MPYRNRIGAYRTALAVAALGVALAACSRDDASSESAARPPAAGAQAATPPAPAPDDAASTSTRSQSEGSVALQKITDAGKQHMMAMSGDVDSDFASMMTMHHQMGIQMMDVELRYGASADLKAMATKMKADQQAEIQQMAPHIKAAGHDMANMPGMDTQGASGTLHQIMTASQNQSMPMSGKVDKDFAMMMTMHHQTAIKMIDALLQNGKDAELKAMAEKMKAKQQDEIKKLAPFAA